MANTLPPHIPGNIEPQRLINLTAAEASLEADDMANIDTAAHFPAMCAAAGLDPEAMRREFNGDCPWMLLGYLQVACTNDDEWCP